MNVQTKLLVMGLGVLGAVYLTNPTAGIIELIPDNAPIIGNLDEVLATIFLLNGLRAINIDLQAIFPGGSKKSISL